MEVIALEADPGGNQVMMIMSMLLEAPLTEIAGKLAKSEMFKGALGKNSAMDGSSPSISRDLENISESGNIVVNNSQQTVNDLADAKAKPKALDDVNY